MELPRFTSAPGCFWMGGPIAAGKGERICRVGVEREAGEVLCSRRRCQAVQAVAAQL